MRSCSFSRILHRVDPSPTMATTGGHTIVEVIVRQDYPIDGNIKITTLDTIPSRVTVIDLGSGEAGDNKQYLYHSLGSTICY